MLNLQQRLKKYKELNPDELSAEQLKKLEKEVNSKKQTQITDQYFDFKLWCSGFPSRQENFANFISKKLAKHPGAHILEIGGGRTGRLSRFLAEKGFIMTCMDPALEVTSTDNIEFIKDKFNYKKFDLSKYDYIIAQEPCEATEHIVRACTAQNKPFVIVLCGVPHTLISGKKPKSADEWYEYLVNISPATLKLRYVKIDPILSSPILKSNKF